MRQSGGGCDQNSDVVSLVRGHAFLGSAEQWVLEVACTVFRYLVDCAVDRIVGHCKLLLATRQLKDGQCRYFCLVRGFSASKYLQRCLIAQLGTKSQHKLVVIVPKRPSSEWLLHRPRHKHDADGDDEARHLLPNGGLEASPFPFDFYFLHFLIF